MIGRPPARRILDHANRNVGVGCGTVHVYDPKADNGTVNSGVTQAGNARRLRRRRQGGENDRSTARSSTGLLGVAAAPDFATTGHVYLQYFPTFNPDNPVHAGLAAVDRAASRRWRSARISRFTINLQTKKLDLNSEVVIFEYDAADLLLLPPSAAAWASTPRATSTSPPATTNSSQSTNGYSGNYPAASAARPATRRRPTNTHCGAGTTRYQDARRTAGNTNDYNGKMLRFNPIDNLAGRAKPTVGVGHHVHAADGAPSPNGPNLFDGTEGGRRQGQARDLRDGPAQPVAPVDRPQDRHPVRRVGRPGRRRAQSRPRARRRTRTPTQLAHGGQLRLAVLHGQQAGLPRPHRRRLAAHRPTPPGYVTGGPATGADQRLVRLRQPRQRLDEQHRPRRRCRTPPAPARTRAPRTPTTSGTAAATPATPTAARVPARAGRQQRARLRRATRPSCARTLTASGATVITGPSTATRQGADNSARWPKYWDGRWFLNDFGNNSAKHALLLDPATDQDGCQPIYADSFRGSLPLGRELHGLQVRAGRRALRAGL